MNIEIKKINFNHTIDYVKDTFYILNKNIFNTAIFLFLALFVTYIEASMLKYINLNSIVTFILFILCAMVYSGNYHFIYYNKIPLKLSLNYTLIVFALSVIFSSLISFLMPAGEIKSANSNIEMHFFAHAFSHSILYSTLFILNYYLFFIVFLLFFISPSVLAFNFFVPVFLTNVYVMAVSYFFMFFPFYLLFYYFDIQNKTINLILVLIYSSIVTLFTFIALNDILGLSKVKRKIKEKVDNKNIETV